MAGQAPPGSGHGRVNNQHSPWQSHLGGLAEDRKGSREREVRGLGICRGDRSCCSPVRQASSTSMICEVLVTVL